MSRQVCSGTLSEMREFLFGGSSRKHRERMQERLKEVVTPVPPRREASPRLFRRLSLLLMERLAWATRELCELVHRFEPKRAQQGTQDFVPITFMRIQLQSSHITLSQNGSRAFRGSASPVGTSPKAKATRNVRVIPCRVQGVSWERVPSGDFAEGESDEER